MSRVGYLVNSTNPVTIVIMGFLNAFKFTDDAHISKKNWYFCLLLSNYKWLQIDNAIVTFFLNPVFLIRSPHRKTKLNKNMNKRRKNKNNSCALELHAFLAFSEVQSFRYLFRVFQNVNHPVRLCACLRALKPRGWATLPPPRCIYFSDMLFRWGGEVSRVSWGFAVVPVGCTFRAMGNTQSEC
jgi:hypothetical protein